MRDEKQKTVDRQAIADVTGYRKSITGMVNRIDGKRFLKAIYISMRDYLEENGTLKGD